MPDANFSPEYKQHIASPEWASIRQRILLRANGKCERPGCHHRPVHVHHKTYVHLGDELDDELEALCLGCHQSEHSDKEICGPRKTAPPVIPRPRLPHLKTDPDALPPRRGTKRECLNCGKRFYTTIAVKACPQCGTLART